MTTLSNETWRVSGAAITGLHLTFTLVLPFFPNEDCDGAAGQKQPLDLLTWEQNVNHFDLWPFSLPNSFPSSLVWIRISSVTKKHLYNSQLGSSVRAVTRGRCVSLCATLPRSMSRGNYTAQLYLFRQIWHRRWNACFPLFFSNRSFVSIYKTNTRSWKQIGFWLLQPKEDNCILIWSRLLFVGQRDLMVSRVTWSEKRGDISS